ncbi:MAG: type II toxin-antitoxin system RelE/ParE family toxin [Verrucomicrobia bacterium]|nr:type II toxin-antitoxin system RelE/ParE family toxin [Verrucomicrobiota bacterium]MDA1065895.1 type II toxin-antitoxin system RelE/ParE family toxin [Verrucomicrobiota bacterium]
MIMSFKHRGLKQFYEQGTTRGLNADYVPKIGRILLILDASEEVNALNLPGFRLHSLKGNLKGFWSISVSGNWRIIFRFEDGDAYDVELIDYH